MSTEYLRFTQYYQTMGKKDPTLKRGEVLWGVRTEKHRSDNFDVICTETGLAVIERCEASDGAEWRTDKYDRVKIVPLDALPGEVCAVLAREALLKGED